MPKITTIRIIHPVNREFLHELTVFYNLRDRKFSIELPENVAPFLSQSKVTGFSQEEAEANAIRILHDHYLQDVLVEKVICYRIEYKIPATAINPDHIFGEPVSQGMSFGPLHALGMQYQVQYRVTVGGKVSWCRDEYDPTRTNQFTLRPRPLGDYNEECYVKWTTELEKFFEGTTNNLDKLVLKIISFFGETPQELLKNIEGSTKALLT